MAAFSRTDEVDPFDCARALAKAAASRAGQPLHDVDLRGR
jgi:hypothetical protein